MDRPRLLRRIAAYSAAVVFVAAALVLTQLLWPWIEPHPTSLFLAAITFSAWYGGFRPSLLATALSALAVDYVFIAPFHSLEASLDNTVRICVFVLVALLISWIDSTRKKAVEDRDQMLVREQEARETAETASRAKDEFLAMVSHELRTPLNVIVGWVAILRSRQLTGDALDEALETIERNAQLQEHLIKDLIDVSRIVTGKMRVDARPIEFTPVIEDALKVVALAAKAKGIEVHAEYPHDPSIVWGDPTRLQQVVWNLLSNAIKFTPKGGRVALLLKNVGSEAKLTIRDNGRGIRPELLPHVFERFRQDENEKPQSHEGIGLGLAIVRHIMELHGGSVEAESAGEGQGATFTVALPLTTQEGEISSVTRGARILKKINTQSVVVSVKAHT